MLYPDNEKNRLPGGKKIEGRNKWIYIYKWRMISATLIYRKSFSSGTGFSEHAYYTGHYNLPGCSG
jgi:hypothetical protein